MLKSLSGLKEDELRAHEQFDEISNVLKKSKEQIKSYKLPVIPEEYYIYLKEATSAMADMVEELNKKPVSIRILNTRVDTARDLALKLYKKTNETIKTAKLAENTIVYGNRFKPSNGVLNQGLKKAEKKFYSGYYKESLEQAINSISLVDSDIHKKLIEAYQK